MRPHIVIERLRRQTETANQKLKREAIAESVIAVLVILFTYAIFWGIFFFVGLMFSAPFATAWIGTALCLSGGFWSAFRQADPFEGLAPPPEKPASVEVLENVLGAVAGVSTADPRYAVAGAGAFFLSGPQYLLNALRTWQHQYPHDEATLEQAAKLLRRCSKDAPVQRVKSLRAAILLKRLRLVRELHVNEQMHLQLTESGRRLLAGDS